MEYHCACMHADALMINDKVAYILVEYMHAWVYGYRACISIRGG